MRIEWNRNPLKTHVFLDDKEKEILKLKLIIESLEEKLYDVYFKLRDDYTTPDGKKREFPLYDPKEAFRSLESWVKQDTNEEDSEQFNEMWKMYISELEHGTHVGDCTCFPCSCSKCYVEGLLGINTIKGLEKYAANEIQDAFENENTTILQALEHLRIPLSEETKEYQDWWKDHLPRWNVERLKSVIWLEAYRDEHFPDDR